MFLRISFFKSHTFCNGEIMKLTILYLTFFVCLLFFIRPFESRAQWVETSGPGFDPISGFAIIDTNLFSSTWAGVFLSTNDGLDWHPVNNGLANPNVNAFITSGNNLIVGSFYSGDYNMYDGGFFFSTNNGTSWTESLEGPSFIVLPKSVTVFLEELWIGACTFQLIMV